MRNRNFGLYAIALAIVVVGALWAGLPVGSLAIFGLILVCPLMMFFMMRGMNGGDDSPGGQDGQRQPDDSVRHAEPLDRSRMR